MAPHDPCPSVVPEVARVWVNDQAAGVPRAAANSVAHEISSPLTGPIGDLALREEPADSATARRVERMRAAAERLEEIVRRMQQITRLEMFRHTEPDLPPMLDIRRSGQD